MAVLKKWFLCLCILLSLTALFLLTLPSRIPDFAYNNTIAYEMHQMHGLFVSYAMMNGGALPKDLEHLYTVGLTDIHSEAVFLKNLINNRKMFLVGQSQVHIDLSEKWQPLRLVEYHYGDGIFREDSDKVLASIRWQSPNKPNRRYCVTLLHNGESIFLVQIRQDNAQEFREILRILGFLVLVVVFLFLLPCLLIRSKTMSGSQ